MIDYYDYYLAFIQKIDLIMMVMPFILQLYAFSRGGIEGI